MKTFACLFWVFACSAQQEAWPTSVAKDSLCVYLVTRGTRSKTPLISEFNYTDHRSSHVGIGIFVHDRMTIFHVTNDSQTHTALEQTTLEHFTSVADIEYWSIWRYNATSLPIAKLRALIANLGQRVEFDIDFDAAESNKLYCSEFCANALKAWDRTLRFELREKTLPPFHAGILGRKTLGYWPVDFFQTDPDFEKIFESAPGDQ